MRTQAEADPVTHQISEDGTGGPQLIELVEDQPHDIAHLLIGVELDAIRLGPDVARRDVEKQLTPAGLVEPPPVEPAAHRIQLDLAHRPRELHEIRHGGLHINDQTAG